MRTEGHLFLSHTACIFLFFLVDASYYDTLTFSFDRRSDSAGAERRDYKAPSFIRSDQATTFYFVHDAILYDAARFESRLFDRSALIIFHLDR